MPFESPDEAKKICLFVSALHQDMQMIGHQAPGMKEESRNGCILFENVDDFFSQGTVGECLCALCGTNRHEVRSPAGVIVPCKVKAFSLSQSLRIIAYSHGNKFCRARRWLSGRIFAWRGRALWRDKFCRFSTLNGSRHTDATRTQPRLFW